MDDPLPAQSSNFELSHTALPLLKKVFLLPKAKSERLNKKNQKNCNFTAIKHIAGTFAIRIRPQRLFPKG
jgi:hypothetical protein